MGLALLLGTSSAFRVIACGGAVDLSSATSDGGANDGTFTGDDAAWDDAVSHGLLDAGKADAFHLDGGGAPVDAGTVCSTPCPGGCLVGGRCLATLASGQARPGRIAVNGLGVYWANAGVPDDSYAQSAVMFVGLDGGVATTIAGKTNAHYSGEGSIDFIAVDDRRVYWWDGGYVWAASAGSAPVAIGSWSYLAFGITVDSKSVYLTTETATNDLWKMDLDGGATAKIGSGVDYPSGPVVGGGFAYWLGYDGNGPTSTLYRVSVDGGLTLALPSSMLPGGIVFDMALGPTDVFLGRGRALVKVDRDGGPSIALASGYHVGGFAIDDRNVYFTQFPIPNTGTAVLKVPLDGGAPTTLASGLRSAYEIAVDDTSVYWTDLGHCDGGICDGTVMKLSPK